MHISRADCRHPPSYQAARARLIGRQKYHAWRQEQARHRRHRVGALLQVYGWSRRGVLRLIAAEVGASVATVCRDRQALARWW
jgi:hypothetical protein